jgi:small subunit ribosomal protein S1
LDWTKNQTPIRICCNVGEKLDVVVLELMLMDVIVFGSQTNYSNPWDKYEESFAVELSITVRSLKLLTKENYCRIRRDIVAFIPTHLEKKKMVRENLLISGNRI